MRIILGDDFWSIFRILRFAWFDSGCWFMSVYGGVAVFTRFFFNVKVDLGS